MNILLVSIGGAAGAITRYIVGLNITRRTQGHFPIGTFLINMTGAVLLGLLTGFNPGRQAIILLADGFLGAYTTFSTFIYEGFALFEKSKKLNAAVYIITSLLLGIGGYAVGFYLGQCF